MDEIKTKIVGNYYLNEESKLALKNLNLNDKLELVSEPNNVFDSNAVAIYVLYEICTTLEHTREAVKLGYIPKEINSQVLELIKNNVNLIVLYKGKGNILIKEYNANEKVQFNNQCENIWLDSLF
jgi:hypothetical protein